MKRLTYRVNTGINDVVLTDKKSVDECLEWGNVLNRLAEYEDLEEQGKLLKLPVMVGGTVWDNDFGHPCSYTVIGFSFGEIDDDEEKDIEGLQMYYRNLNGLMRCSCAVSEIGKTVFLTKEEAEAVLKSIAESYRNWLSELKLGKEN